MLGVFKFIKQVGCNWMTCMFIIIHYLSNYYNIYKVALLEAT